MDQYGRGTHNNEQNRDSENPGTNQDQSWGQSQQPGSQPNGGRIQISLNLNDLPSQHMEDDDEDDYEDSYDDEEDLDQIIDSPLPNMNIDDEEQKVNPNLIQIGSHPQQYYPSDEWDANHQVVLPPQNQSSVIRIQNLSRPQHQQPENTSISFNFNPSHQELPPSYELPQQMIPMSSNIQSDTTFRIPLPNEFHHQQHQQQQPSFVDNQEMRDLSYSNYQQPNFQQQEQQPVEQLTQQADEGQEVEKKHKKKTGKKKKSKAKREDSLMNFYTLVKTHQTLEIDTLLKGMRAQTIYSLELKNEEAFKAEVTKLQQADSSSRKVNLNLHLFAKMIRIVDVAILQKDKSRTSLLFDYAQPEGQSQFQSQAYSRINRDLHSQEAQQKSVIESEQLQGQLKAHRVLRVNLKKDIEGQFPPKLKILVCYFLDKITEFGLKAVTYKQQSSNLSAPPSIQTGSSSLEQDCAQYYYTSDHFNSNFLWMPMIAQASTLQHQWTLKYLVPTSYEVISSGMLISKVQEQGEPQRTLFTYKLKSPELASAQQIGFICGQFPYIHKLNELSNKLASTSKGGVYSFFLSEKKLDTFKYNSFYEKNFIQIINHLEKLINAKYPCLSTKLVFVPNLFPFKNRKQSIDYGGGVHIFDEEILFNRNQLENRYRTYKYLTIGMAFDYFGNKIFEESPEDYWLIVGIKESIGNYFKISKCGVLLYRYHMMKTIESVYQKMKKGIERSPISSSATNQQSQIQGQAYINQIECYYNELFYEKCELIMHMIESMIDKQFYEKIIRQLYQVNSSTISSGMFMKIFKDICGFKLKSFCQNWILSTSCPKLEAQFSYNKKNNSLDLSITQQSAMKYHFMFRRYLKQSIELQTLYSNPYQYPEFVPLMKAMEPLDSFFVELKRECSRWFTGEVNVMIYLTDGAEIQTQQQKMSLKYGRTSAQVNIPLHCKVKKTIQNKKKEYENMLMFDDEEDDDMDDSEANIKMRKSAEGKGSKGNEGKAGGNTGGIDQNRHQFDNSAWKFGLNDFELEIYPYGTKNLFEVKNLDSPVLWIRIDPDMEFIRKVKVVQNENNWLFQLLSEKDVIGQIEAIRELGKITDKQKCEALGKEKSQLIYEILQTVSNTETYFFKVRKEALQALQKIQTTQFHQYLSLEKTLTSIFKQRNLDQAIDLFKSNDFSKILEYFMDKYIIKTLAKCKELQLTLKKEIQDKIDQKYQVLGQGSDALPIQQVPSSLGAMSISINIAENEVINTASTKAKVLTNQIDERKFCISSEQIAQMLIKLLSENDNSLNPFDDTFYLKQIIKSLGSLDNPQHFQEIGHEIYRQFKLDHIGSFSPQFALTKGAIAGYFNLRKGLFIFRAQKLPAFNVPTDVEWFNSEAFSIEVGILNKLDKEIIQIVPDQKWPLDVRDYVIKYSVKHEFKYKSNSFLKALFILLKQVDFYQMKGDFTIAQSYLRNLVYFLEKNLEQLDYREVYLMTERAQAIADILWQFLCLPHSYLDSLLTYWVKRLYSLLYDNETPTFYKDQYQSDRIQAAKMEFDEEWMKKEDQFIGAGVLHDDRKKLMNRNLASRNNATLIIRSPRTIQLPSGGDGSNKIVMANPWNKQQQSSIFTGDEKRRAILPRQDSNVNIANTKISLGGVYTFENLGRNISNEYMLNQQYQNEDQEMDQNDEVSDNESIYDEFAAVTFQGWMQKAWLILGVLWYHEEAGAFLNPITEEDLGELYETYMMQINYPMDFSTIKSKMYNYQYNSIVEFRLDVLAVFKNCKDFNHEDSEIHQAAVKLEKLFWEKMSEHDLLDAKQTVRIGY